MKRIISLLLVIAMVLGCTCTSMAATNTTYNHNRFDVGTKQKGFIGIIYNGTPFIPGVSQSYNLDKGTVGTVHQSWLINYNGNILMGGGILSLLEQFGDMTHYYRTGDSAGLADSVIGSNWKTGCSYTVRDQFTLFGKHWACYSYKRTDNIDGVILEKLGFVNLDTGVQYPFEYPVSYEQAIKKNRKVMLYDYFKLAPALRTLGYNVAWNKEFNSLIVTSPGYTGPTTPTLTAEDKKILDWAIENKYVIPNKDGSVDYTEALSDEYMYKWIANLYGMDRIKKDVNDLIATHNWEFAPTMWLALSSDTWQNGGVYWCIELNDKAPGGFILKYRDPAAAKGFYDPVKVEGVPTIWPEDELDSKYIFVWLMTFKSKSLFSGDRHGFQRDNTFGSGLYGAPCISEKKSGFNLSCNYSTEDIGEFILCTMTFVNDKRAEAFCRFFNMYYDPTYREALKKYNWGSPDYKCGTYDLNNYLTWTPISNWFFKGEDWQGKTRYYAGLSAGGLGYGGGSLADVTILEWARIAYAWNHIDYVSDESQWESTLKSMWDKLIPAADTVWDARFDAYNKFMSGF